MISAIEYFCSLHPPNSFIEILTSTVTVLEGGDFIQRKKIQKKYQRTILPWNLELRTWRGSSKDHWFHVSEGQYQPAASTTDGIN